MFNNKYTFSKKSIIYYVVFFIICIIAEVCAGLFGFGVIGADNNDQYKKNILNYLENDFIFVSNLPFSEELETFSEKFSNDFYFNILKTQEVFVGNNKCFLIETETTNNSSYNSAHIGIWGGYNKNLWNGLNDNQIFISSLLFSKTHNRESVVFDNYGTINIGGVYDVPTNSQSCMNLISYFGDCIFVPKNFIKGESFYTIKMFDSHGTQSINFGYLIDKLFGLGIDIKSFIQNSNDNLTNNKELTKAFSSFNNSKSRKIITISSGLCFSVCVILILATAFNMKKTKLSLHLKIFLILFSSILTVIIFRFLRVSKYLLLLNSASCFFIILSALLFAIASILLEFFYGKKICNN